MQTDDFVYRGFTLTLPTTLIGRIEGAFDHLGIEDQPDSDVLRELALRAERNATAKMRGRQPDHGEADRSSRHAEALQDLATVLDRIHGSGPSRRTPHLQLVRGVRFRVKRALYGLEPGHTYEVAAVGGDPRRADVIRIDKKGHRTRWERNLGLRSLEGLLAAGAIEVIEGSAARRPEQPSLFDGT